MPSWLQAGSKFENLVFILVAVFWVFGQIASAAAKRRARQAMPPRPVRPRAAPPPGRMPAASPVPPPPPPMPASSPEEELRRFLEQLTGAPRPPPQPPPPVPAAEAPASSGPVAPATAPAAPTHSDAERLRRRRRAAPPAPVAAPVAAVRATPHAEPALVAAPMELAELPRALAAASAVSGMPPLSLGSVRMPALRGGSGLGMAPGVRRGGSAGGGRAVPFDLGGRRALRQAVLSRIVLGPPRGLEPAGA